MTSPDSKWSASSAIVESVGGPDGTITHAARGDDSFAARSSSDVAGSAPFAATASRASAERSNATTSCPAFSSRSVMLAPILPRPTIPIFIVVLPCLAVAFLPGRRRSGQRARLVHERLDQLVERLGERVDALVLERRRDVREVDARAGQRGEDRRRTGRVRVDRPRDRRVVE